MKSAQYTLGAGRFRPALGGVQHASLRGVPHNGDQRAEFLPLEEAIPRDGVAEVRTVRVLEEENCRLRQLVADLSLDKQML